MGRSRRARCDVAGMGELMVYVGLDLSSFDFLLLVGCPSVRGRGFETSSPRPSLILRAINFASMRSPVVASLACAFRPAIGKR